MPYSEDYQKNGPIGKFMEKVMAAGMRKLLKVLFLMNLTSKNTGMTKRL